MEILHIIAGPVIGAVIGYCTNYIAVKMLFKPLEPVYLFGRQLPFTPGVIPKNKMRIARACGQAVSQSLLTEEDLSRAFLDPSAKEKVTERISSALLSEDFLGKSLDDLAAGVLGGDEGDSEGYTHKTPGEEKRDRIKAAASEYVTERIRDAILSFDIEDMLSTTGVKLIMEKIQNSMLAMFLNEGTVRSFIEPAAAGIRRYLETAGTEKIGAVVEKEINCMCALPVGELADIGGHEEEIRTAVGTVYEQCMTRLIPSVIGEIDIAGIVVDKIEEMDIGFFEDLVLSVMKHELDYVVRLGALIGFVIGIINIFL